MAYTSWKVMGVDSTTVFFNIVGRISDIQRIASGKSIRERRRLLKLYGGRRWRKLKGIATVEFADGRWVVLKCTGTKLTASAPKSSR